MQKNKSNNIRLGIFVSLGLALFMAGIYYIGKRQQLFGSTFRISCVFKDISGLQVGNSVRLSGINVGVVQSIDIVADTSVRVGLSIDEKVRKFISTDSKATIGSDGLMGNKLVIILPGISSVTTVQNNGHLATYTPVNVDAIMNKLQITINNVSNITGDLSAIMDNIRSGKGTIGKLFMDTVLAKNIDQTVVNIKQGAGGFNQNMQAASHNILLRGFLKKKEKEEKEKKEDKKQ
ncbi:MAG TPA: MlaD family protein [Bacteroidia bacterium]|jgi:phospholipid/cholesterol/gamma-HCH transport system substrate-binding protein|nr:MlaD family protein [Bacteroidia bacterium]